MGVGWSVVRELSLQIAAAAARAGTGDATAFLGAFNEFQSAFVAVLVAGGGVADCAGVDA